MRGHRVIRGVALVMPAALPSEESDKEIFCRAALDMMLQKSPAALQHDFCYTDERFPPVLRTALLANSSANAMDEADDVRLGDFPSLQKPVLNSCTGS